MMIPDYDFYPIIHTLVSASISDNVITVNWSDGAKSLVIAMWLREYSPDESTFHPVTREQIISLTDLPENLEATFVEVTEDGFLRVIWAPGGHESRYHPGWLRAHSVESDAPLFELPAIKLMTRQPDSEARVFDGKLMLDGSTEIFTAWLEAIHSEGLGLLKNLPLKASLIPQIPEMIGSIRTSNFGNTFEVVSRPDANSNAYTALALEVHSDLATREYVPGLQFLFCLKNDADGGDSIVADGFAVAEKLKSESAEFYEALSSIPVSFGTKDKDSDYRFTAPIFEHDRDNNLTTVRHTYWLRSPMLGDIDTITTFYAAYRRFQEIANSDDSQMRFRLNAGELMAIDNRRMLHGRSAFDPMSGERILRGCYSERDELTSRLRILARNAIKK